MKISALILGISIVLSTIVASYTVLEIKQLERVVTVKGLAEREVDADIAIFPIKYNVTGDKLDYLLNSVRDKNKIIFDFLIKEGFDKSEISISLPNVTDKKAYNYDNNMAFRYLISSTINVYTDRVLLVIATSKKLGDLSDSGIIVASDEYGASIQYLFEGLNEIKPSMVEEATKNGREVAKKFAKDSGSRLGKIKRANQGQFSVYDRDSNTPYIKRVRVVSTVEYYLK